MVWGGLFLSWYRPSREQQKACVASAGGFNYDSNFHGASSSSSTKEKKEKEEELAKNGFSINQSRILLGSGSETFHLAKSALLSWKHFGLDWAFVNPETPVKTGTMFCACVKELVPWVMMPLQIAYVTDEVSRPSGSTPAMAAFSFGSGTLQGHLLAGEERFSIQWDENDQVWYEIFSLSKPAHVLSVICYPYVQFRQKYFARQSTLAVLKHVNAQHSKS
ncbi:UPF0548 protein At2g17695 [Typha latifolia]|uniref:UPF0548 protein At2g17695 n=1 Tax=Typha latifolia TaxID=4733 RepID=UPI003C2F997E